MNPHSPADWPQYKETHSKYKRQRMKGERSTEVRGEQQNQGQRHFSWLMRESPYQLSTPLPPESKAPLDHMCPNQGIYLFVSIFHSATICISLTSSYPSIQNKHNSHGTKMSSSPIHLISSYEDSDLLSLSLLPDHPPSWRLASTLFLFQ